MSRKGRRNRSKKGNQSARPSASNAPLDRLSSPSLVPAPDSSPSLVPGPEALENTPTPFPAELAADTVPDHVPPVEPAPHFDLIEVAPPAAQPPSDAAPDSAPALSFEAPLHGVQGPLEGPEGSVPPVGDLPVGEADHFFFDEVPSESWLAELDIRDPRWIAKTTVEAARRRAHLTRYVISAVGVAAALCLAALVRVVVPPADEGDLPRPAVRMVMPGDVTPASPGLAAPGTLSAGPETDPAAPSKGTGADAGPG
jgi:hypothetical protein